LASPISACRSTWPTGDRRWHQVPKPEISDLGFAAILDDLPRPPPTNEARLRLQSIKVTRICLHPYAAGRPVEVLDTQPAKMISRPLEVDL
jgi:hypothetical protein